MYIRRSEGVQDVFWTCYVCSIYVLCLLGKMDLFTKMKRSSEDFFGKCEHFRWCLWIGSYLQQKRLKEDYIIYIDHRSSDQKTPPFLLCVRLKLPGSSKSILRVVARTPTIIQGGTLRNSIVAEKVFLKISQNSQENTCARVSFLIKLQAYYFS